MRPPLEGLRILAIEQYGAGPYGSCHLADMGARGVTFGFLCRSGS